MLEHTGPKQVLVGEPVRFAIKLSNPGSGAATSVVIQEDVPPGLSHSSGTKLEYEVGRIEPGQTRQLELTLQAAQPGQVQNTLMARADAGLLVKNTIDIEVVAPKLQVGLEGPSKRYLDRQATFTVSVANPGTAPAHEVELVAQLPTGLKFVSTNNSGYYDQSRHAVVWSLQQLPAGEMGKAQFTALPTEMGEQRVHAEGKAQMGLESTQDLNLTVEGISALLFSVADQMDPIEVGGQTVYEVKVTNQGSKAATNVSLAAMVPEGMQAVSAGTDGRADSGAARDVRIAQQPGAETGRHIPHHRAGECGGRPPLPSPVDQRRDVRAGDEGREHARLLGLRGPIETGWV